MSKGVVGRELLDDRVVAMEAVVASSKEGGVHGGSLPRKKNEAKCYNKSGRIKSESTQCKPLH